MSKDWGEKKLSDKNMTPSSDPEGNVEQQNRHLSCLSPVGLQRGWILPTPVIARHID